MVGKEVAMSRYCGRCDSVGHGEKDCKMKQVQVDVIVRGSTGAGKTVIAETIRRALLQVGVEAVANFGEDEPTEMVQRKGDEARTCLEGVHVAINELQTRGNGHERRLLRQETMERLSHRGDDERFTKQLGASSLISVVRRDDLDELLDCVYFK